MRLNSTISASYSTVPQFVLDAPRKETAAQAGGRRYDEKVGVFLAYWATQNGYEFKDHPWISYCSGTAKVHYCQPDYVLLSKRDDNLLLIEVKVRHTRDAVTQLRRYSGLIAHIHPEFKPSPVEICRYFDASECAVELMPRLRPHPYPIAAVIFEPNEWTPATN